ncbi:MULTISPECIES: hypothetical protein [Gracilibacillus]|mgnify:CR=1 FL=1|uniref:Uncharacterized protein n=1 Tax=Gracilibacillus thailandensis TaxID=563735 RepID=A0A6N7QX75_9BACI|nr:hypothetical protein [Gracilibacillus thailandensis]MRI66154.1 hypothetical protein [Gracilibacillus thailandensis]
MKTQYSFKNDDGKVIPFYKFSYQKDFSSVLRVRKTKYNRQYLFADGTYLPQFISSETAKQFDFNSNYVVFEKAMLIIVHAFAGYNVISDLDNYTYKPFIDTIRKLKIIEDDTWRESSITNIGVLSEEEKIDLYVVPFQHYIDFLIHELKYIFTEDFNIQSIREKEEMEKLANDFF